MIRKSRFVAATAAHSHLASGPLPSPTARARTSAGVQGKVTPTKLDKKKYKPVTLFAGVTTSTTHPVPGQQNAEKVQLEFGRTSSSTSTRPTRAPPRSSARPPIRPRPRVRLIPSSARASAHANLGGGPDQVNDVGVTVFNGPGPNHIRLHAYSPTLGAANARSWRRHHQVAPGRSVRSGAQRSGRSGPRR